MLSSRVEMQYDLAPGGNLQKVTLFQFLGLVVYAPRILERKCVAPGSSC